MAQTRQHPQIFRAFFVLCSFAVAALTLSLTVAAFSPKAAYADYSMPSVRIQAQAETDGSLHVVEQRVFDFESECTSVWWSLGTFSSTGEVHVNSVRMVPLGSDGGSGGYPQVLESVPFVLDWRESGGPGVDAYSFDQVRNTVYAFFDASDERLLIEIDYTVENGVVAYRDVGEVYWQFVGSYWTRPSEQVEMTLMLPMPADAVVEPGVTVRAWGHGPADGRVRVNEDGSVSYTVPRVEAGNYAEAHVVFPAAWLTNLPSGLEAQPHRTESHLSDVLAGEQAWADQASRSRMMSLAVVAGSAVVCLVALCWGLWAYWRHGREYEPSFKDDYWRDVPDDATPIAVIGRLWRWNRPSLDDLCATVLHLTASGILSIREHESSGEGGVQAASGYELARREGEKPVSKLDAKALEVLFGCVAQGESVLPFGEIPAFGQQRPNEFLAALDSWQDLLSQEVHRRALFEESGRKWQKRLLAVAGVLVLAGAAIWVASGSVPPLAFALITGAGLAVLGNYCERRSREGNEICAKCKALRNWLRDAANRPDGADAMGDRSAELSAYAYLFGISGEEGMPAMRSLKEMLETAEKRARGAVAAAGR